MKMTLLPIIGLSFVVVVGCSGESPKSNDNEFLATRRQDTKSKQNLVEIGSTYGKYIDTNKKPPLSVTELQKFADGQAEQAIRSERYIIEKGVQLSKESKPSETLLAYEYTAPSKGGWVLLCDQTVRVVTPEEFDKLKKPSTPNAYAKRAAPPQRRINRVERLNELRNIGLFYRYFQTEKGRAPKSEKEFLASIKRHQKLVKAIEDGYYHIVVNLRRPSGIVAYEPVPVQGTHGVVKADGVPRNMSTADLKSALEKQGTPFKGTE